ncbi:hypothetical protein [Achromobacter sp.]|uniref:hypothetical protein n=1 Tax=Achromobacter sp. TaxID=134375 RepID=UPI003C74C89C
MLKRHTAAWVLAAAWGTAFFHSMALAAQITEFPSQSEIYESGSEMYKRMQDRNTARNAAARSAGDSKKQAGDINYVDVRLETDIEMMALHEILKTKAPPNVKGSVVESTPIAGSLLEGCREIAQADEGLAFEGKFSATRSVYRCGEHPLISIVDSALAHGPVRDVTSLERVNSRMLIQGVERGVIVSRSVSNITGNGVSAITWRDANRAVTIFINDASEVEFDWLKQVAQSLK